MRIIPGAHGLRYQRGPPCMQGMVRIRNSREVASASAPGCALITHLALCATSARALHL